ncbi:hypothetical protein MKZ38_009666 [Zalerion maritima]|uniref:UBR-type domain-containing protein n=1 Tax=Zalerion maritima TaxID=339359 RepID=A0AAD5WVJ9_9PEZI|nr:hypothetical protein MKZ38_009666 [Zalerion maritima]
MSDMPPPPPPPQPSSAAATEGEASTGAIVTVQAGTSLSRKSSFSGQSEDSQTAADFIRDQMQLEADAREALPYSIENCTKLLGPLRQNVFACLTCNPPPKDPEAPFKPAGVCYSCSVQCHGEHILVEIFSKRNFTCDCGTTRFPAMSPCSLRLHPENGTRGGVHSEEPSANNKYNQNFRNRFCSCSCDYDPFQQEGTMYQCLGLGTTETGGCGEDWYHPGCLVGLGPKWFEKTGKQKAKPASEPTGESALPTISEATEENQAPAADATGAGENAPAEKDEDDVPPPPGFPDEDAFESFICYKCVEAHPWIKRYAGTEGFLPAVYLKEKEAPMEEMKAEAAQPTVEVTEAPDTSASKKRKVDDGEEEAAPAETKRAKTEEPVLPVTNSDAPKAESSEQLVPVPCKVSSLPPTPTGKFSLFFTSSFREQLCHCSTCFPLLKPHEQLLEEEETYEPPISSPSEGGSTAGSGSLYDRGESALKNVDRVRAIEGVMAYNHLKDKLKPFFKQFAESGEAISADDIKGYFAKLRGDDQAIKDAGEQAKEAGGDNRREQSGY